jgi:hypothetical protein
MVPAQLLHKCLVARPDGRAYFRVSQALKIERTGIMANNKDGPRSKRQWAAAQPPAPQRPLSPVNGQSVVTERLKLGHL